MIDDHLIPDVSNWGILPYIMIFGIKVYTYTLFMILAFVAAFIVFKLTAQKRDPLERLDRRLIITYGILGGILGSKLPILIANFPHLFHYPDNINLIFTGKTIIGGLIGGGLSVMLVKRIYRIKIKVGNDLAAPAALAMGIGRLGCLFQGCCYGKVAPKGFGLDFGDGVLRYSTQVYEMIFDFAAFFIFLYFKTRKKHLKDGILFKSLLNGYYVFRILIEFIRQTPKVFLDISYYQIICLICLLAINRKIIWQWIIKIKGGFHHDTEPC